MTFFFFFARVEYATTFSRSRVHPRYTTISRCKKSMKIEKMFRNSRICANVSTRVEKFGNRENIDTNGRTWDFIRSRKFCRGDICGSLYSDMREWRYLVRVLVKKLFSKNPIKGNLSLLLSTDETCRRKERLRNVLREWSKWPVSRLDIFFLPSAIEFRRVTFGDTRKVTESSVPKFVVIYFRRSRIAWNEKRHDKREYLGACVGM